MSKPHICPACEGKKNLLTESGKPVLREVPFPAPDPYTPQPPMPVWVQQPNTGVFPPPTHWTICETGAIG